MFDYEIKSKNLFMGNRREYHIQRLESNKKKRVTFS